MVSLTDLDELVGFFSYSREDDDDSEQALSTLRTRIQNELRTQLGRSKETLRLWQDREAIPPGTLWESQIDAAVNQAVFFIPIVTPRVLKSEYCGVEFRKFLDRETELKRRDLVFPILYIDVEELENEKIWRQHPVLRVIGERQYVDWREFRYEPDSPAVRRAIASFCRTIAVTLRRPLPGEKAQTPDRPSAEAPENPQRLAPSLASQETENDVGPLPGQADAAMVRDEEKHGGELPPKETLIQPAGASPRKRRLLLGGIAGAACLLGATLFLLGLLPLPSAPPPPAPPSPVATVPTPPVTPAPPPAPAYDTASCADVLCGSRWAYTDTSYVKAQETLQFLPHNALKWSNGGVTSSTYRVTGTSIYFEVNDKYSEYRGTIKGQRMDGTAKNKDGYGWTWSAVKQ
jgi:TIR domain